MAKDFYKRLHDYYYKVAEVLRGEADAASIFSNTSDIGTSRELIYAKFLKEHAPSKCNVFLGGFLFGDDGSESNQLDVIISTDTTPRYDFHNPNGEGKSFAPVEGCLEVVSIKSNLDKAQLFDSLKNITSIPPTKPLEGRINPFLKVEDYDDWPLKIIYASDGISLETMQNHITEFYNNNPDIPINRRPDIIHVSGKYVIFKMRLGMSMMNIEDGKNKETELGKFYQFNQNPDMQAITWTLNDLQKKANISTQIIFDYNEIMNKVNQHQHPN